ncbi:MAG: YigZ family protein, partial [Anaerolineaceae bacterium]
MIKRMDPNSWEIRMDQEASYQIPAEETSTEILVVNSRFIANLAPAFTVEEARVFHKRMKQRYSDATHHVPAFVIGHGNSVITHCSD